MFWVLSAKWKNWLSEFMEAPYTRVERNEQLTNQCVYMLDKNTKMLNEVRDLINQLNKHQN